MADGGFSFTEDMVRSRTITGAICIAAYCVVAIPSTILYWYRRHEFPISKRFPYQALAIQLVLTLWILMNISKSMDLKNFPCTGTMWGEAGAVAIGLLFFNFRLLALAFRYYLSLARSDEYWKPAWKSMAKFHSKNKGPTEQKEKPIRTASFLDADVDDKDSEAESMSSSHLPHSANSSGDQESQHRSSTLDETMTSEIPQLILCCIPIERVKRFCEKVSWLQRPQYGGSLLFLMAVIFLMPHVAFSVMYPTILSGPYLTCVSDLGLPMYTVYGEAVVFFLILIFLGFFILPKVIDSIDYRTEVIFSVIFSFCIFVSYGVMFFMPQVLQVDRTVVPLYPILLTPFAILITVSQIILPVILTYRRGVDMLGLFGIGKNHSQIPTGVSAGNIAMESIDATKDATPANAMTLQHVLKTPKLLNLFQKFLQSEFAQENLYFLIEAEEFRYAIWKQGKAVYRQRSFATVESTSAGIPEPDYSYRIPSLAVMKVHPIHAPQHVVRREFDDWLKDETTQVFGSSASTNRSESVISMLPKQDLTTTTVSITVAASTSVGQDPTKTVFDYEILAHAFRIIRRYLLPTSPLELNIPVTHISSEMRQLIHIAANKRDAVEYAVKAGLGVSIDVFDEIQKHIFELLKHGSFPRFKRSSMYLEWRSGNQV